MHIVLDRWRVVATIDRVGLLSGVWHLAYKVKDNSGVARSVQKQSMPE